MSAATVAAVRPAAPAALSRRERQVLEAVADGRTTPEIAAAFGISPRTVDTYRAEIRRKLGLHRIADLVRLVLEGERAAAVAARDAWRDYAEHAEGCVECSMTSWRDCFDGTTLRELALTADAALAAVTGSTA